MYQFLKNLKMNYVVSAIVCIVFGLTLVIWPDISSKVVCIGVGIVLLLSGIANLITYFGEKDRNLMTQISLIAGIILAVLGGWIILNPQILIMVIPVVMGVIVAVHGVHNLLQALELFKNEYSKWWVALLLGAVTVGLGVLLIFNPFVILASTIKEKKEHSHSPLPFHHLTKNHRRRCTHRRSHDPRPHDRRRVHAPVLTPIRLCQAKTKKLFSYLSN